MPTLPTDPLRRVTLNLFEADVIKLQSAVGPDWTVRIRDIINDYCKSIHIVKLQRRPTLGDLPE